MKRYNECRLPRRRRKHAFTLMELMVALLIIGLLSAVVLPRFVGKAEKAKKQAAKMQVKVLDSEIQNFYFDMSRFPERLGELVEDPGSDKWDGPYLKPPKIPEDPWGNEYVYEKLSSGGMRFRVYSPGPDGVDQNGEGDDISNLQ